MGPPGRLPTVLSVRQRDTFIPAADAQELPWAILLEGSLFVSVASAHGAYGMKIALTSAGKIRLPRLVILNQGGFREKDRPHARESDHPADFHVSLKDARCRLEPRRPGMGTRSGVLCHVRAAGSLRRLRGDPLWPTHLFGLPPSGRRPTGDANA